MCRSVISDMCTPAAHHDALARDPVSAVGRVRGRPEKAPRGLTVPQLRQLRQLRAALTYVDGRPEKASSSVL